jgi:hypothetical protein
MNSIRELITLCLACASLLTIPFGILSLVAGFSGGLVDAERGANVQVGIIVFLLSLIPSAGLLAVCVSPRCSGTGNLRR